MDTIGRIAMGQTDSQMFKNPLLKFVRAVRFGTITSEIQHIFPDIRR